MAVYVGIPPPIIGNAQAKPSENEKKQWGIREDIIFNTYPEIIPAFVKSLRFHTVPPPVPIVVGVATSPNATTAGTITMPMHSQNNIVAEYKIIDFFSLLGGHDKIAGMYVCHLTSHISHLTSHISHLTSYTYATNLLFLDAVFAPSAPCTINE